MLLKLIFSFGLLFIGLYAYYFFYPVDYRSTSWDPSCDTNPPVTGCLQYCAGFTQLECKDDNECLTTCSGKCYGIPHATCDSDVNNKPSFGHFIEELLDKVN